MTYKALVLGAVMLGATASASQAQITYSSDLATWQALVGPNYETTVYGSEYDSVSSITLDDGTAGGLTLNVSPAATIYQVGSSWSTWCCGYTGQVLYTGGGTSLSFSLTPGEATTGIGFYAEPNPFAIYLITLDTGEGTVLSQLVDGSGGATFFGFSAPNGAVTGFSVYSNVDFAVGDFWAEAGVVPEASTWAMMLVGFAGLGFAGYRRAARPLAI